MKIIDHTAPFLCTFSDLPVLAVFKSSLGSLYMKLPHTLLTSLDDDADKVNAILLTTGEATYFNCGATVCRVEATLTIAPITPPS